MKYKILVLQLIIISVLSSCSNTSFIDDGNGHKQYKDKNGNYVKTEWVDLNGKKYYFDRNGYLVTNQWIDNEYYADENGMMKTNYWYEGENGYYYLDNDGKYLRNTIKEIDGNFYAFDLNGVNIKNAPFVVNGEGYYFGNDGKADKKEGWKNFLDTYCYVKDDGHLLISEWKEDNDKWYYFNEVGLMARNSFVDGSYYVDENGEMVKNKKLIIGTETYVFDNEGKGTKQIISFRDLKNKYAKKSNYWVVSKDDTELTIKEGPLLTSDFDLGWMTGRFDWKTVDGSTKEMELVGSNYFETVNITKLNQELKLPNSTINKILNTNAYNGLQMVSANGITLTWSVTVSSNRKSLYLNMTYTKE